MYFRSDRSIQNRAKAFIRESIAARTALLGNLFEVAENNQSLKRKSSTLDAPTHNYSFPINQGKVLDASNEVGRLYIHCPCVCGAIVQREAVAFFVM